MALLSVIALSGLVSLIVSDTVRAVLPNFAAVVALAVLSSTCLAQRSLDRHLRAVADALDREGLPSAQRSVGAIVGRDVTALDKAGVARAAIESLAENFADGVVAPAFWLAVAGLPGVVVYKAINTADSMIGHRSPRHEAFGFAAAKTDDLVNLVPARVAALLIVCAAGLLPGASIGAAWRTMLRDARGHPSPNAGWPEAAMAGALGVRLGGPRTYSGRAVDNHVIGDGEAVLDAKMIRRALQIYRMACGLQILIVSALALIIAR